MTDVEKSMAEKLLKLNVELSQAEKEYVDKKLDLELLKAQYALKNDWEKVFDKKKVTVSEKEAYIKDATEIQEREINELRCRKDYLKRVYEIHKDMYRMEIYGDG